MNILSKIRDHQQPDIFKSASRKALQEKGQFWTPQWVARAMVRYLMTGPSVSVFDPAVGAGAFFVATKAVAKEAGVKVRLSGTELYSEVLAEARNGGLTSRDLANVVVQDYLQYSSVLQSGIVANPPYLRHHKIGKAKASAQAMAKSAIGEKIDARAGLHVYFFIKALKSLAPGGRLAFILPADISEGVFANKLWNWISRNFRIDAVAAFSPEATPFPGVDTNALVFFISKNTPAEKFAWAKWNKSGDEFEKWVAAGFPSGKVAGATVFIRTIEEGINTGLSRAPMAQGLGRPLGDFVRVVRGIATGENSFFFLTKKQIKSVGLPMKYFVRAVGRTRDINSEALSAADLDALDKAGRPTYLLYLGDTPMDRLPRKVRAYLEDGEKRGVHKNTLIATRNPWYKMEIRESPAFLFAYLGRADVRFIKNSAGAKPLTGFLCVYPKSNNQRDQDKLWEALKDPRVTANLKRVGKSYGDGAVKVEPRSLEKLWIPDIVLKETGLDKI